MGCAQTKEKEVKVKASQIEPVISVNLIESAKYSRKQSTNKLKTVALKSMNEKDVLLENIILDKQPFFDYLQYISLNQHIEKFTLRNVEFLGDYDYMISIANTLKYKKNTLKELSLINLTNLGSKKGKCIAKILIECTNLEKVILREISFQEEEADSIALALHKYATKLKILDLSGNYFESSLKDLLESLSQNDNIEELYLRKMDITSDLMKSLVRSLENNNLTVLDLSNNPIKDGVKYLKDYFYFFANLTQLLLNNCDINDKEFFDLLDSIKTNKTLTRLELNTNNITEASASNIALFFNENSTLKNIYLLKNPIVKRDIDNKLKGENLSKIICEF